MGGVLASSATTVCAAGSLMNTGCLSGVGTVGLTVAGDDRSSARFRLHGDHDSGAVRGSCKACLGQGEPMNIPANGVFVG